MAFVVEDGTGLSTANSYASVAEASAYFADRGNTTWSGLASDTLREQALVKGTDFLDSVYRFVGLKSSASQALQWPREDALDVDGNEVTGVPEAVKRACYEAAVRSVSGELLPDLSRGGQVKKEKVDVIEVEYMDGAPAGTKYEAIDNILRAVGLIRGKYTATGSVPVTRV